MLIGESNEGEINALALAFGPYDAARGVEEIAIGDARLRRVALVPPSFFYGFQLPRQDFSLPDLIRGSSIPIVTADLFATICSRKRATKAGPFLMWRAATRPPTVKDAEALAAIVLWRV